VAVFLTVADFDAFLGIVADLVVPDFFGTVVVDFPDDLVVAVFLVVAAFLDGFVADTFGLATDLVVDLVVVLVAGLFFSRSQNSSHEKRDCFTSFVEEASALGALGGSLTLPEGPGKIKSVWIRDTKNVRLPLGSTKVPFSAPEVIALLSCVI